MMKPMSVAQWKTLLVSYVVFACVLDFWALTYAERVVSPSKAGTLGATFGPRDAQGGLAIRRLEPGSPLAAAGAVPGDRVRFDHYGDIDRFVGTDETIGLVIFKGATSRHAAIHPMPGFSPVTRARKIFSWFVTPFLLIVGFIIGWSRPESSAARALSVSLLGQTLLQFTGILPGGVMRDFAAIFLDSFMALVTYVAFLWFVLNYPEEKPLFRHAGIRYGFWALIGLHLGFDIARCAWRLEWTGADAPAWAGNVLAISTAVVSIAALAYQWRTNVGLVKQRLAWLLFSMGAIYFVYLLGNLNHLLDSPLPFEVVNFFAGTVILLASCLLGYAVVFRRVLDFAFAVNRAIVYGTTSLVLAAAFIFFAQVANRFLHFEERERSPVIDAAVALGLALCGRQIARTIDPKVQRVFYRKWHAASAKLERFHVDTMHSLADAELLPAFVEAVREYSGAVECAIYKAGEDGSFRLAYATRDDAQPFIDANDPLAARIRGSTSSANLSGQEHGRDAAVALPLRARDRISGMLVLGEKPNGQVFRTDEVRVLANSAKQLGLELELRRLQALEARIATGTPLADSTLVAAS